MLIYDTNLGAFKNVPAFGSDGAIQINNTGTGVQLASSNYNSLNVKSLAAGNNITLSDNGQTITINSTGGSGQPNLGVLYKELSFNSGTTDLITLPAGAIILRTEIAISVPFDGSPILTIGTASDQSLLVDNSEVDLTNANTISYKDDVTFVLPGVGSQAIQAYITQGGATQGTLSIFIEYSATSSTVPVVNASVVNTIADRNALNPVIGQFAYVLDDGTGKSVTQLWVGNAWITISTSDSATSNSHTLYASATFATSSAPILLGYVSPSSHVIELTANVLTAFNGTPAFSIGTMGNNSLVSNGSGINLSALGTTTLNPNTNFTGTSDIPLYLFFNKDSSTVGSVNFTLSYL